MSRNKHFRKRLKGIERQNMLHRQKIEAELAKPQPDWERIAYWSREIRGREKEAKRIRSKLPGGR